MKKIALFTLFTLISLSASLFGSQPHRNPKKEDSLTRKHEKSEREAYAAQLKQQMNTIRPLIDKKPSPSHKKIKTATASLEALRENDAQEPGIPFNLLDKNEKAEIIGGMEASSKEAQDRGKEPLVGTKRKSPALHTSQGANAVVIKPIPVFTAHAATAARKPAAQESTRPALMPIPEKTNQAAPTASAPSHTLTHADTLAKGLAAMQGVPDVADFIVKTSAYHRQNPSAVVDENLKGQAAIMIEKMMAAKDFLQWAQNSGLITNKPA